MPETERTVVVTGAAQGLGAAVATAFAEAGYSVMAADLDEASGRALVEGLADRGGRAAFRSVDIADEQAVTGLAAATVERFGSIDVWVNNAGISRPAMLHKMEVQQFDSVLAVHARGTFLGLREAARVMIAAQTHGTILNVTSSAGLQGTIGQINYAAAKGAIISMTKSAARELARHRITVNAVAPVAATPMTERLRSDEGLRDKFLAQIPMARFGETAEIAPTFVYLASDAARYITGQVVCVDGGLYMAS